ncbi:MAG TPA: ABC transporter substrate-binding protein [Actinophytocola sp.]|uniref:ABC transporter substrate-binding protein n=1 Tax=Actinophytocola sp. TaxID=1872138 RepID=UPI002DDD1A0B|nr:ABC transporter substrate-binding protein [Actinophytocola sp.]HEV2782073.1 ABC transporter substrate-binding protein [Actinophytocola sp.]
MVTTRRALALGAAMAAATVLAACGSGQVGEAPNQGGQTGAQGGNKKLALVPGVQNEPFYISMQCGAEEEARGAGYELQTNAPQQFDATLQEPIVTGLAATKPAALLIAPTDDVAMTEPIKQVKNLGVVVVEVDTALKDTSVAVSTITSNNEQGGRLAAETMSKLANGKSGSVLVLDTKAGTSTTNARAKGFEDELKKYPNLKSAGVEFTQNEPDVAASKVTAALSSKPDLIGIFATNLNSGEGAATGLRNAGKIGAVNLIGFDASPSEVEGLKAGEFQALIAQDPATIGKEGVKQAIAKLDGKDVKRNIEAPLIAITKENMSANEKYFYKTKC